MTDKKVVAHIVQELRIGGLERVIETIVTGLNPEKYDPIVLCLTDGGEIAHRIMSKGIDVKVLQITDYHSVVSLFKVTGWLKKKHVDISHTHGYPAGVLGRVASKAAGVSSVFHHFHTTHTEFKYRHYLMERFLTRFTKRVVCCSNAVKEFNRDVIGLPNKKLVVLYNAIPEPEIEDFSRVKSLKQNLGIPEHAVVIGCIASLVAHKGHPYLLEAVSRIEDSYLLLVGDGVLRETLETLAAQLGIAHRVIFAGRQLEVNPFLQIMDVVVLASCEREGLGNSLIEAMAFAKPVVATRIGGIPEIVQDGKSGFLVPVKDRDALMTALMNLVQDPDTRAILGARGREKYQKTFQIPMMIKQLDFLYNGEF